MISGITCAGMFQIKPVKTYPDNYNECVDITKKEKKAKADGYSVAMDTNGKLC